MDKIAVSLVRGGTTATGPISLSEREPRHELQILGPFVIADRTSTLGDRAASVTQGSPTLCGSWSGLCRGVYKIINRMSALYLDYQSELLLKCRFMGECIFLLGAILITVVGSNVLVAISRALPVNTKNYVCLGLMTRSTCGPRTYVRDALCRWSTAGNCPGS